MRVILFFAFEGAAALLIGFAALFLSLPAWSAERTQTAFLKPGDARSGSLLLKTEDGYADASRLGIDVDITVSGPTVRARVTQVFRNPTQDWVEAVYVYPLPSGGAVDTLKMVVGDRVIVGDIKERQQARIIYEQAARNGQKAALTEQQRPNIFTNSVANIGPGETVLVQIEYQEQVAQSGNEFSLRLPMVIGPRYNPAPVVQSVDFRPGGGWGANKSDPVPDRDRISPHVLDPATNAPVNPTSITVRLQAGFPLGEIKSHHHTIKTESPDGSTRIIKLVEGAVPADRDFELTWKPAAEKAPSVGLFREHVGGNDYLLAFVTPPSVEQNDKKPLPREVIFVIDNSGSMGGVSIIQAKASLTYALGRLQPTDRFNVIRFDHTMEMLFPASVPADRERVGQATSFVGALQANGGTEMVPAMRAALSDTTPGGDTNYVRQVVFLTDGAIGNEQQLFETINALRGRSRIFMVGIGSAPNTHLMTRAAELGRGAFTHIGSVEQVEERMRGLFSKLENPAVTNLTAKFSDATADITPSAIPDLYRDEPLILAARLDKLAGSVEIKGRIGDRPWVVTLPLANAAEGKGLSKLWARRKIADAEVARTTRQESPEDADKTILALALDHQLVTRLTSLVAVDKTPSRPEGEPLKVSELPINLPAGWDFAKVFGERPLLPVAPTERRAEAGEARAQVAALKRAAPAVTAAPVQLPKTATDAELKMILGVIFLIFSLVLFAFNRRQALIP
ncbi:marine proteobacterial sortase target protein [Bradyrhizobium sp. AUGA SZCCT0222]|uniref:marine proteobacterial sortase target protein n=1 Tax=Bradyrhizobium sp. AUGA SZCCT0222 TaxID=2807668 RepID=UPI0020135CE4|nr:marine proteobacterial sortase target protein [Bradyrhizobium sp. AUGA SZCCT0222]